MRSDKRFITLPGGKAAGGSACGFKRRAVDQALRNLKVRYIMPLYVCPNQGDLCGFQG